MAIHLDGVMGYVGSVVEVRAPSHCCRSLLLMCPDLNAYNNAMKYGLA